MFSLLKRLVPLVVVLLSLAVPAMAQDLCLEGLNRTPECSGVAVPAAGDWQVITRGDGDVPEFVDLELAASDTFASTFGTPEVARLQLRCHDNNTSMTLHFPNTYMSELNDGGVIETELDGAMAPSVKMSVVKGSTALSTNQGSFAIPIIMGLFDHTKLTVRATPFRGSPIETVFMVAGLSEAIPPLRAACGW